MAHYTLLRNQCLCLHSQPRPMHNSHSLARHIGCLRQLPHLRIQIAYSASTDTASTASSTAAALAAANTSDKDLEDLVQQIQSLRAQEETVRKRKEDLMAFLSLKMLKQRQQRALQMRQQMIEEKKAAAAALEAATHIMQSSSDEQTPDLWRQSAAMGEAEASLTASMSDSDASSLPSASVEPITSATTRTAPSSSLGLPKRRKGSKRSKSMMAMAAAAGVLKVASEKRDTSTVNAGSSASSFIPPSKQSATAPAAAAVRLVGEPPAPSSVMERVPAGQLENDPDDLCLLPKPLFIISDCTGESAARTVRAALGQFELWYKMSCPANLVVFRFLNDEQRAYDIIAKAAEEDALVVYTLVGAPMVRAVRTACQLYNVRCVDLWSTLLDNMEQHLQSMRKGVPLSAAERQTMLSGDYFRFIEAVEYTRKMDDGANPQSWHQADLLILGVSRSGKTPLSIYLGQRGYKVANLPLVPNAPIPKELYEIDQSKIVGLLIDGVLLASIRRTRVGSMGLDSLQQYTNHRQINAEIEWAQKLYQCNPEWPVIDVTFRGVEETAARILAIMDERGKLPQVPFSL